MKIIDAINALIEHGAGAKPLLDSFLSDIAAYVPDLAPEIEEYRAKLDAAPPPDAEGLISELKNFVSTRQLDPRQKPSDLA